VGGGDGGAAFEAAHFIQFCELLRYLLELIQDLLLLLALTLVYQLV
jgi:hypothetical protein